ncbi:MAG TPA: SHD1 domain-containing protein [Pirellulales bacterium]|jgi:hypothetical protein|nr:SHD1 domain-containing protein [Pirellulales bacterium]
MSERFGVHAHQQAAAIIVRLIVGLLLLVGLEARGQERTGRATGDLPVRNWTDRSGTHHAEASLVEVKGGQVTLKKKDGTTIHVPLDSLSDADQDYVRNYEKEPKENAKAKGATTGPPEATVARGALPQAKEVVVTGIGIDPEKALQNAFSQAIEQTVGLLVDAETVVKNDELIRDEVLTFSRGYMETFEVVKQWQKDGLHHATIRATVARNKLVTKLKRMKIAMADTPGELASRQFEFDAKNEEQAAEMFKKALADFDMTKLTKAAFVSEVKRDGLGATIRVAIQLSADKKQWNGLAKGMRQILTRTATRRASIVRETSQDIDQITFGRNLPVVGPGSSYEFGQRLKQQLKGDGVLVALLKDFSIDGSRTEWELFRVPQALEGAIKATRPPYYAVTCVLYAERGEELARNSYPFRDGNLEWDTPLRRPYTEYPIDEEVWYLGPVWAWSNFAIRPTLNRELSVSLANDDLRRLSKTVVFLEEDIRKR